MAPARISPWRRMRRSLEPSNGPGRFVAAQFSAGCTTNMSGFDFRQAQDGSVACLDPADLGTGVHLQREFEPLGTEPKPNATRRSHLGKARKHVANGGADSLVGVKADLAIALAPNEADPQTAAQVAPRGLIADSALEAGPPHPPCAVHP